MSLSTQDEKHIRDIVRLTLEELRPEFASQIRSAVATHAMQCGLERQNRELKFGMKSIGVLLGGGAIAGFFGATVQAIGASVIKALSK